LTFLSFYQDIIKKVIQKDKLFGDNQLNQAHQESVVQGMFKHENIVELYDYFEDQQDITMLMEYCNDAKYFENKIENVSLSLF